MLERYAKFVPQDSIGPIFDLLPDNPRKLKGLIRGLVSLQPQLARHNADELNWTEVWLAEMIRQESQPFFAHLLDANVLEKLVGVEFEIRRRERMRKAGGSHTDDDSDVRKVVEEVGGISEKRAARLIELVNAARLRAGFQLSYSFKFALRPEAVTRREFYELVSKWKNAPSADTISGWTKEQSRANSIGDADIEAGLFEALLSAKDEAVSRAADASTVEQNAQYCAEAESLLRMTEQFLGTPKAFTAERFGKLYRMSLPWIAFDVNPADRELRASERGLICSLADGATEDDAPAVLETLRPWRSWDAVPEDRNILDLKRQLRDECVRRLMPQVERAFAAYVRRPGSLRLLLTTEGSEAFRYILLSADRLPWAPAVRTVMIGAVKSAKTNPEAHDKAEELLDLLVQAGSGTAPFSRESAARVVEDREFVRILWQAATSRPIQYRMLTSYVSRRKALIQLGAKEADLPLSTAMHERMRELTGQEG